MTLPYYGRVPTLVSIAALLDAVCEGSLRIARFQRRFLWRPEQRVQLLDSIYRDYPIGTLFVWRTRENRLASEERVADLLVPDDGEPDDKSVKEYVLDGLQRISTLYGALGPALLPTRADESRARAWNIYFDLDTETFASHDDLEDAPRSVWQRQLPLSVILDTTRFLDALEAHRKGDQPGRIENAQKLLRQINRYQVPILPLITEKVDDAVTSFTRLNTAGTKLDTAAILHALSFQKVDSGGVSPVDLLRGFDSIRERVKDRWAPVEELDDEMLRHITSAALQVPIYSDDYQRFVDGLRASPQVLDRVGEGVDRAVWFLREQCHVCGPRVLPYMFQFVLLARVLLTRWPLDEAQNDAAKRWFWATTFTHHFASQRRVQGTLKDLEKLLDDPTRDVLPDARRAVPMGRFQFKRARDKGLALRLAMLGPAVSSTEGGDPVEEAASMLAEIGGEALHELIPARRDGGSKINPVLLHDAGNIVIERERRVATLLAHVEGRGQTLFGDEPCDDDLLRRHAIPPEAVEALRKGDPEAFIRIRGEHLRREERAFVESLGLSYGLAGDDRDEP